MRPVVLDCCQNDITRRTDMFPYRNSRGLGRIVCRACHERQSCLTEGWKPL